MILNKHNDELKRKLNKLMKEKDIEKYTPTQTILLLENHEIDFEDE